MMYLERKNDRLNLSLFSSWFEYILMAYWIIINGYHTHIKEGVSLQMQNIIFRNESNILISRFSKELFEYKTLNYLKWKRNGINILRNVGWFFNLKGHASKMFLFIQFSALTVYFVVLIDFPLNLAAVFRFLEPEVSSTNNAFG